MAKLLVLSTALAICLSGLPSASAHHAFAMFDSSKREVITGTVERFAWTNPHVWLYLKVPDEDGAAGVEWNLEGPAIRTMAERGWKRSSLQPGDSVTLVVHPRVDGDPGGHMIAAQLSDGSILQVRGPAPEFEASGETEAVTE